MRNGGLTSTLVTAFYSMDLEHERLLIGCKSSYVVVQPQGCKLPRHDLPTAVRLPYSNQVKEFFITALSSPLLCVLTVHEATKNCFLMIIGRVTGTDVARVLSIAANV